MEFHSLVQWHRGVGGWGGGCVPGDLAVNLRDAEISPSNLFLISGAWSVSFTLRDRARLRTLVILAGVAVLIPVGDPCFGCLPSPAIFDLASPLRCPLATWTAGFYSTFFCFIFFSGLILLVWWFDCWITHISFIWFAWLGSKMWRCDLHMYQWLVRFESGACFDYQTCLTEFRCFFIYFISYYFSFLFCCINWFFTCYTRSLIVYVGCWKWRSFLSFCFNFL